MLEASTLRTPEILIICHAIKELPNANVSFLYLEPKSYNRPRKTQVLHRRLFELSDDVEIFSGVPGSVIVLRDENPNKAVFLVGYEGQRLDQALEQLNIRPSRTSVILGVPAFQPGWEMDSFANNLSVIKERDIKGDILFAGAENISAAFNSIEEIYKSCDRIKGERLLIIPIGTKPHGIAAALFACKHKDVGLVYDYPQLKEKRSSKVSKWHLFNVNF